MQSTSEFLKLASDAYYSGNPIISDEEFDSLAEASNYYEVGHKIVDGVPHMHRMYSLNKTYQEIEEVYDEEVHTIFDKLDGAACAVQFRKLTDGVSVPVLALTRGDGRHGKVCYYKTDQIPKRIDKGPLAGLDFQVNFESVAPKTITNARNYAAGALNHKNLESFMEKDVTFVALSISPSITETYLEDLELLEECGFNTVKNIDVSNFPTDGKVIRINNNEHFESLGYTARHPRGALAIKKQKDAVITKLLDVKWDVGRSGVVTPVAVLEPVLIGDAKVSRATLHNIDHIRLLDLRIGDMVQVIRSGEIIPKIIGKVDEQEAMQEL